MAGARWKIKSIAPDAFDQCGFSPGVQELISHEKKKFFVLPKLIEESLEFGLERCCTEAIAMPTWRPAWKLHGDKGSGRGPGSIHGPLMHRLPFRNELFFFSLFPRVLSFFSPPLFFPFRLTGALPPQQTPGLWARSSNVRGHG